MRPLLATTRCRNLTSSTETQDMHIYYVLSPIDIKWSMTTSSTPSSIMLGDLSIMPSKRLKSKSSRSGLRRTGSWKRQAKCLPFLRRTKYRGGWHLARSGGKHLAFWPKTNLLWFLNICAKLPSTKLLMNGSNMQKLPSSLSSTSGMCLLPSPLRAKHQTTHSWRRLDFSKRLSNARKAFGVTPKQPFHRVLFLKNCANICMRLKNFPDIAKQKNGEYSTSINMNF